jgi:hypothetical protein
MRLQGINMGYKNTQIRSNCEHAFSRVRRYLAVRVHNVGAR